MRDAIRPGAAAMRLAITNVVGMMIKIPTTVTTAGEADPMPEATRLHAQRPPKTPSGSQMSRARTENEVACQPTTSIS